MDLAVCRCPHDREPLVGTPGTATCARGHRFSITGGVVDLAERPAAHDFGRVRAAVYDALLEPLTLRRLFGVSAARMVDLHRATIAAASGGVLCDVPCGSGLFSIDEAARAGVRRLVGVDGSRPMLERAHRRVARAEIDALLVRGDLAAMPLADGIADAAISSLGLQFVAGHAAALGELRRVLRPGGHLLAIAPALGLRAAYDRRHARRARKDHPIDRAGFARALGDAGFADVAITTEGALVIATGRAG